MQSLHKLFACLQKLAEPPIDTDKTQMDFKNYSMALRTLSIWCNSRSAGWHEGLFTRSTR
jgi:hypothetical protein